MPIDAVCLRCMERLVIIGPRPILNKVGCDVCGRPLLPASEAPDLPRRGTIAGLCKPLDPATGRSMSYEDSRNHLREVEHGRIL